MKKLSIRSLLIVILALVLVFALVACNDKGNDNPTPTPEPDNQDKNDTTNVKAFFNTLWEQSTEIGGQEIAETDDLKVSLGLTVKLDFVGSTDGQVKDSVDVGVLLDLVLDRSSGKDNSTNTAIKAKIYDPSAEENWFTAYYFFNDVDNVYIDYAGQNVKIPFSYLNDTYNKSFYNFIFNEKVIGKDDTDPTKGKSIAEIITALTANMGKNWDLNTLVGDVMSVFNVSDDLIGTIGSTLQSIGIEGAIDEQGKLNIKNILTNETVAAFFDNSVTGSKTVGDVTTYTTQLDSGTISMIGTAFGSSLPAGLADLLDELELFLEFTTKNNKIDTFTIKAGIHALEGENADSVDVYPVVAITVTDLKFAKATEGAIENSMEKARDQYTDQVVLDAAVAIDLKGVTLDATAFDKEGYDRFSKVNTAMKGALKKIKLDGTLALTLNGKLDLKNTENNGTVAAAALTYKAADAKEAVDIVKASFKDGTLALTVNQEATVGDVKIVDALVRLFGDYAYTWIKDTFFKTDSTELDKFAAKFFSCNITEELAKDPQERVITINPDFKGAAWKNFDIVGGFQGLVKKAIDAIFPPKTDDNASAQYAKDPIVTKVAETFVKVLPLLSTKGDKLTVKTNDNELLEDNYVTVGAAINYIGQTWWVKGAKPFTDSIIAADKDNWLGYITEALTVKGTTYGDETDSEKKAKTFLNEMFASTAELVLNISGATGIEATLNVAVNAEAGVGVSVKLGAKAYNEANYTDLAASVTAETAGWYVFTVTKA
ncbi:MAG TPA: hypothetical protein DCS37_02655 [Clostridiales bacterium]|nr:hypothetical protein [Clostridiales bacterium]